MRAIALLLLPPLAALACVYGLAAATGGPTPARPGATHSFVWKKRVFTSKQQFSAWLERRDVSYADWRARHPGASLPWEDQGHRLEVIAFLAAALAGILAFLVRARRTVRGFVGRRSVALLERLRPEEVRQLPASAGDGFSLREAVAVYGVTSPPRVEQRNGRPDLVLVDPPAKDAPGVAVPEREAVAVAANRAPRRPVEPPRRRRPRAAPRRRDLPVEEPAAPAPREEPPVAIEPEPEPEPDRPVAVEPEPAEIAPREDDPVAVEPEPEPQPEPAPVAIEPEPEPRPPAVAPPAPEADSEAAEEAAVEAPPRRRRRVARRSPKAAPRPVSPPDEQPVLPEPESPPPLVVENRPIAEPEGEAAAAATPTAAVETEAAPETTAAAPPSRRGRRRGRPQAAEATVTPTPAEQPAPQKPRSAPAIPVDADAEPIARVESPAQDEPVPPERDAGIEVPARENGDSPSPEPAVAASEEPERAVESPRENGRPVDDPRTRVPAQEPPEPTSPVAPMLASFGPPGSPPPMLEVREVVCEIAYWQGFVSGQFYARLWGDTQFSAIATSPKFRSRSETPEQTEECLAALGALTDVLIAEGWTSIGRGRAWYAKRFTNHLAF